MNKYILVGFVMMLLIVSTVSAGEKFIKQNLSTDPPKPPEQPSDGPGGSNYSHSSVKKTSYGWGAQQYWIFEPQNPVPETAPLIIFNHGWCAVYPFFYQSWINHIVKRGNIVVYPRYQFSFTIGFRYFCQNAINAVKKAIVELQTGSHVKPDLNKVAIVGHSLGGGITANMAALAEQEGLPIPKAIMPVQPAIAFSIKPVDFSIISSDTLMLVIVGENDTVVGNASGKTIFYEADTISSSNKDFVIQISDYYGYPPLVADHVAPAAPRKPFDSMVDAMDYYSTWKLFDALTDFAFYGNNGEYCFGNTPEQRFMGLWNDGTPVKELIVTDTP